MTQISQSMNPSKSPATQHVRLWGDIMGKGAAAPEVSAVTVLGARNNFGTTREGAATTFVRNAAGDYTITWPAAPPDVTRVLSVIPVVRGTTANMRCELMSAVVTAGKLVTRIFCYVAAATGTDLADGVDFVRFSFDFDLSNA